MNNGVLIFAHNSDKVDYGRLSIISGALAKKNLKVPVSLAVDISTIEWMKNSDDYDLAVRIFDSIVEIEKPSIENYRILNDGLSSDRVPFINSNRYTVYDISPYDRTLLIDSDYLIFTDKLSQYWSVDNPLMISGSAIDIGNDRLGILDQRISDTGINMVWATTVMFDKSSEVKFFFEMVNFVRQNYRHYADIFRYDFRQYRNDIAFSVALHILNGFETHFVNYLPSILTSFDKDQLLSAKDGNLIFDLDQCNTMVSIREMDLHIMNKQSIIRNKEELLKLI
jgi:hypothetical protein